MKITGKKTVSFLLSLLILLSVFGAVPMSASAASKTGRLGSSDVYYELTDDDTLRLYGSGATPDYPHEAYSSPFYDYSFETVVVEEGITKLGNCLFAECSGFEEISLPQSLLAVGDVTFGACSSLKEITFHAKTKTFGFAEFISCSSLKKITFEANSITCYGLYENSPNGLLNGISEANIYLSIPVTVTETFSDTTTTVGSYEDVAALFNKNENTVYCVNDNATIKWKNADGTVLETDENATQGEIPTYDGETPTKKTSDTYCYVFKSWTPEPFAVMGDMSYTATYTVQGEHTYGEPEWTWDEGHGAATAKFTCTTAGCGYDKTVRAAVTRKMEAGKLIAVATVEFGGQTYTDEISEDYEGGIVILLSQTEGGTVEADRLSVVNGDTVTLTFQADDTHLLYEYNYSSYNTAGERIGGGTTTTYYRQENTYALTVSDFSDNADGYIVITPVYKETRRIVDATGGDLKFRLTYTGYNTDKGMVGERVFVFPSDYVYDDNEGCVIENVTVTDKQGNEVSASVSNYAEFTMPDSDVTVNAVLSTKQYIVEQEYDPIRDIGYIRFISSNKLAEGETFEAAVESSEPYIITGLYAMDKDGNRTDLMEYYDSETGKLKFTMPAKSLKLYREHGVRPGTFLINTDTGSSAPSIGYINFSLNANHAYAEKDDEVTLSVHFFRNNYGVSTLYYVDGDGQRVDLMPSYNKNDGTFTFTMPGSDITLYYSFVQKHRLVMSTAEGGTVSCNAEYADVGDTVTLTFQPEDGYVLYGYQYCYYNADGSEVGGGAQGGWYVYYYTGNSYDITILDRGDEGSYIVITPVFKRAYRITDNTGRLNFRYFYSGDNVEYAIPGERLYAFPDDYIDYTSSTDEGYAIDSITVTDADGNEVDVELYSDARFTMPASDVTVNAAISDWKYKVHLEYDPIRDHGIVRAISSTQLRAGDTFEGQVESFYPYMLTALYSEDKDGNQTDLIANGSYDSETGIVSFTMPAKPLTIYREHVMNPDFHYIYRDEQSASSDIGYINRNGYNYLGGIMGEEVTLTVTVSSVYQNYGLSVMYYMDKAGNKVDLMPNYDRNNRTVTFTMPDSDLTLYYSFGELRTVTIHEYENNISITGFAGETKEFEIFINDYAREHAKLDATYFYYYDSNNEYHTLDADWDPETGKGTFVMPDEDITLHIQYMYYRDVPVATFDHGTVTADKEKAIDGEIVTYTVHPDDGWIVTALGQRMSQYYTDGVQDENDEDLWYVTMPWGWSGERTLWANFEEAADWHTITIHDSDYGSVSYGRNGARTGKTVNLVVTPDEGYLLDALDVRDGGDNKIDLIGTTFTMPDSDVTVTATFKESHTHGETPNDQQFVTIDDQISITLALDLGTRGKTTDDVSITVAGAAYDAAPIAASEGVYKYIIEMAPAQIADEIVVTIGSGNDAEEITTSIKDYCNTLRTDAAYQAAEYANARALANAILEYGQAANDVFGPAAEITSLATLDKTAVNAYTGAVFTDGTGKVSGASFMALTKPEFRFYTSSITEQQGYDYNQAGVTTTMDGGSDALTARFVKKADGKVLIEVTGVTAENMDKTITVTVADLGTITFNGNAFAKAMAKSSTAAQQNLGAALYNYGAAAKVCFAAGQETPVVEEEGVDLSKLDGDYEAQDGDVLTGTLSGNKQITIADGASITLRNADISSLENNKGNTPYAGITLLGDATILLEGTNIVKGGYEDYPGISVPQNKTLTINGTGSLHASSNGFGCGIGGASNMAAGNIVINGGTITATGGRYSVGIGGGNNGSCGNITINGGTVTAIGGSYSAGIGSSIDAKCGTITIAKTVTQVTATKGSNAPDSIGAGFRGTCGTVTIEDGANVTQN